MIGMGSVWHRRLRPVTHAFRYRSYFLMLPMRSLARAPAPQNAGWRRNRFAWLSFHDRDHGEGGDDALAWVEGLLRSEGIADADGEIWLQTYPRVLGHVFKPVSFWYAHRQDGSLAAVVAEVNNTFGERHCYLLHGARLQWGQAVTADKVFHVSPFCRVEGHYAFTFQRQQAGTSSDTAALTVRIDLHDEHGLLLQTGMAGRLFPLTARTAQQAFWGTPLMSLGVVVRIHWHAWRLWLKRVPFFNKPPAPTQQVSR